jgi:adenosine kinase
MLNGSQDYKCHLLGCIGKDQYGTNLKNMLNKLDVTPILEEHATLNTSRCGVGIFQKERCLLPELNASPHLSLEFVKSHEESISKCEYLYVEGYFTKDCPEVIKYLIANFKARGKKVIFTLSATFMIEFFYDFIKDVADQADIIFCNREEAECFAKRKVETPIDEISLEMHKLLTPNANRLLVITCGSDPVSCSSYNREHQQLDFICHSNVWKITDDQIVDTNGCGDSFTGGFLSQYVQGKSIEHCLRAGNYASSVIIRNIGCTFPEKNDYKC